MGRHKRREGEKYKKSYTEWGGVRPIKGLEGVPVSVLKKKRRLAGKLQSEGEKD